MEKYHVLVIEDDIEIANAIKIYLQNQGYDVYVGNDGIAGLEIVEKETIHLAIVDIMMPRMDGLTMVAKLREKYDFPVIFLSAKSEAINSETVMVHVRNLREKIEINPKKPQYLKVVWGVGYKIDK